MLKGGQTAGAGQGAIAVRARIFASSQPEVRVVSSFLSCVPEQKHPKCHVKQDSRMGRSSGKRLVSRRTVTYTLRVSALAAALGFVTAAHAAAPLSPDPASTLNALAIPGSEAAVLQPAAGPEPTAAVDPQAASVRPGAPVSPLGFEAAQGSTYIPLDSWVYPQLMRLYSLGYVSSMFLSQRPYTRQSVVHMLELSADDIFNSEDDQAIETYRAIRQYLEPGYALTKNPDLLQVNTAYTRLMGIGGNTLRDSYHVGESIVNDYGRPYEPGFNNITGFSTLSHYGRFSFEFRGEYQNSPSASGYTLAQTETLLVNDQVPFTPYNPTIPYGPISTANNFRMQEANFAILLAGHEVSFGKSDDWWGPGLGAGMGYSNNAENIYGFRINRVEPLYIPFVSKVLGPVRYDFLIGSLKGHTAPNTDYTHSEGFTFRPTDNFEFGFERTVVWGGKGHEPVTLHTFLKSFFDVNDTTFGEKLSRDDPGARFTAFNFSYRLPFVRKYLTFYTDSEDHDDVTPISAPRRAAIRPGLFLSKVPGVPRLDFRVEAASTDPPTGRSINGSFMYWEAVQKQAYTNQGQLFGDWIGREGKGGQAWLTYHLSGNEWIRLQYRNAKAAKDFIPGGTTQNVYNAEVLKRITKDIEVDAWYQHEDWKAPVLSPNGQSNNIGTVQITWYPKSERSF